MDAPRLPLSHFRLAFAAEGVSGPGDYAGSAWRGAFGRALRRALCVTHAPVCDGCLLLSSCGYPYLFATAPPPAGGILGRVPSVPHPYVLAPGRPEPSPAGGVQQRLDLTLFGRGHDYLAYTVLALERAAAGGVGPGRRPFHLREIRQESRPGAADWQVIYRPGGTLSPAPAAPPLAPPPAPACCRVALGAPTRLTCDGRPVRPGALRARDFLVALLRRIHWLAHFHAGAPPRPDDLAALVAAAERVRLAAADLRWWDWHRYSARQRRKIPMGGLAGWFELAGPALAELWPYLWLGQWTHVGKGGVMGLGRYRLAAAGGATALAAPPDAPSFASLPSAPAGPPLAMLEAEPVRP